MRFPDLARTFRTLVSEGKKGFYTGRVAEAIVELIKNKGGVMELSDLATHDTEFVEPIKYTYAGEVTLYEVCQPSCGGIEVERCFPVSAKRSGDHCAHGTGDP
jgi:gamma-glutamyltranspeptidase/glutathione hydrolase